jgi:hypothetical protein
MILSQEEIVRQVKLQLSALSSEQFKAFDDESLAWLALVPSWSERLAELAVFPGGSWSLQEFLDHAEAAGICERDKRDHQTENAQRSTRVLAVLWQRFDEEQKRKFAPKLSERVRAMPAGPDQKRMLRYLDTYANEAGDRSWLSRLKMQTTKDSAESSHALESVLKYLGNLRDQAPSALDPSLSIPGGANLLEGELIGPALTALSQIADPEVAMRALASLTAALPDAAELIDFVRNLAARLTSPEMRTQLVQYVASSSRGELRKALQAQAIESTEQIEDPVSRAFALLNTSPDVPGYVRERVSQKLLAAAQEIPEPALRARILTGTLPFLDRRQREKVGADAVAIADNISDPVQRIGILAPTARALAEVGEIARARELAESAGSPTGRAQILLEIVPHLIDSDESVVASAIGSLDPASLEEVVCALSPEASVAVAKADANRIAESARLAGAAGRFSPAAKMASLLTERARTKLFGELLNMIRQVASLPERLEAISQIAAYLPPSALEDATTIANDLGSSPRFWVADSLSSEIIEYLRERKGPAFLPKVLVAAGKGILAAGKKEALDIAPATARWASIADQCASVPEAAAFVAAKIRTAVTAGNTGEALEILNVATPLAKIVGAELEPAVVLGRHRIQIAFRQAADERHLVHYLPRQEQIDAFNDLIAEPDGPGTHWALHYLGMGGVGKTMLLRHIMARLAVKDGSKLPVTRVDFDHISPDFPARKPGELLASLAEELRFYGLSQESRFNDFSNHLNAVHDALSHEPPPDDPLRNIETHLFRQLLDKFAALLNELPKPVILILDTCEELAKLEPAGAMLPSVEATFRILEELHSKVPHIRVVFAGRRLLARAGDEQSDGQCRWTVEPDSLSERNKLLPSEKGYVRLHIVRGFTEEEVSVYFSQIVQLEIDEKRRAAILHSSPDAGTVADIKWLGDTQPANDGKPRYNPFDLSLYADWVREDPNVLPEVISSGETDPYVEVRIIRRITDEALRKVLPATVLLRRFDIEMLRDVVPGDQALRSVYRDLGAQEWIDYQQDVLQVDVNLLPRLERYYQHKGRRYLLDRAQDALRPSLADILRKTLKATDPFSLLTVTTLDAALRLLPAPEAAALWDRIDRKVTDQGNWPWADNVCRYLLNENNAAGSDACPLRAAVRATMAAVALHSPPYEPVKRWWQEVADTAQHHPDEEMRAWLKARADIAIGPVTEEHILLVREMRRGDPWRYEQLAAGFAASLERSSNTEALALPQSDFRVDESIPLEIRAFMTCLYARRTSDPKLVEACKALAELGSKLISSQRWADWRAPACLPNRMRLELLRTGRGNVTDRELKEWSEAARLDNVDSERLLSRVIQLTLERGVFPLRGVPIAEIYDPNHRPDCPAHREVPPLFAMVAEALLVVGRAAEASQLATAVLEIAQPLQDTEAITAAKLILLLITRRMRGPNALTSTMELIASRQPSSTQFHRWWATQIAISDEDTARLLASVELQGPGVFRRSDGSADAYSALDAYELNLLAKRIGRPAYYPDRYTVDNDPFLTDFPPRENLRLTLRKAALSYLDREPPPFAPQERREAAEIALEEAELLALRLPSQAEWLFLKAFQLFAAADDSLGDFRAPYDSFGTFRAFFSSQLASPSPGHKPGAARMELLERIYEVCRSDVLDLPNWAEIQATELARYSDHAWFDWLLRIARLKALATEPGTDTAKNELDAVIANRYGSQPQLDLIGVSVAEPRKRKRTWPHKVLYFLGALLVAALVTGALVVGVQWLWRHPQVLMTGAGIVGSLVIVGLVLVKFMLPRLAQVVFRVRRPRLLVQAGLVADKIMIRFETNETTLEGPGFLHRFRAKLLPLDDIKPVDRPGYQSYRDVASRFALALEPLQRLQAILFTAGLPVTLIVDKALEHYAWEAPFNLAIQNALVSDSQFVRLSHALPQPTGMEEWSTADVHVTCRSGLGDLLARAWSKIDRNVNVNASGAFLPPAGMPLRVLHVVGWSTSTASGPTFSIERPIGPKAPVPVSVSGFPVGPAVVIIQEDPVERIRRFDVDREQTTQTRAWAAGLFRDGAQHTVVLIPALPLFLARRIVETIAKGFRGSKPPDMFKLLKVVTAARRAITSFRPPAVGPDVPDLRAGMDAAEFRMALRELSLEITVFSRPAESLGAGTEYTGFANT